MRLRRKPFTDVVERQLALFGHESAGLVTDCDAALEAYNSAERDEAEALYGDYLGLLDTGRDELEEIRDTYALTLDEETAEAYRTTFNELARKRYPRFGFELE